MSQTTLPVPAAKQPRPSRAERPRLLTPIKRGSTKIRARALPILSVIPGFEQCNVNDARTVLAYLYDKPENYQTHAKRRDGLGGFKAIKEDTGLSRRRLQSALRYLEATGIKRTATVMGDGGFKGRCYVLDLDGKAPEHHVVVDFHQAENRKRLTSKHRADTRWKHNPSAESWAPTEEPKPSLLDDPQYLPKVVCTEAVPQYPYNDIPTVRDKRTPIVPQGGTFQSFSSTLPVESPQLPVSHQVLDRPELPSSSATMPSPADEDEDEDLPANREEAVMYGMPWLFPHPNDYIYPEDPELGSKLTALKSEGREIYLQSLCDYAHDLPTLPAELLTIGITPADMASCQSMRVLRSHRAVARLQQERRAPRGQAALDWLDTTLLGPMLRESLPPLDNEITPAQAALVVRRLRRGTLTVNHIVRYWARVYGDTHAKLPMAALLPLLSHLGAVKDEEDVLRLRLWTIQMLRLTDYTTTYTEVEKLVSMHGETAVEMIVYAHCHSDTEQRYLPRADFARAAKIMALQHWAGANHEALQKSNAWLVESGITVARLRSWFTRSVLGNKVFGQIAHAFSEVPRSVTMLDCFGLSPTQQNARFCRMQDCMSLLLQAKEESSQFLKIASRIE